MIYTAELTVSIQSILGVNSSEYSNDCVRSKLHDLEYKVGEMLLNSKNERDSKIHRISLNRIQEISADFMQEYIKELDGLTA